MAATGASSSFPPYMHCLDSSRCLVICIAHIDPFFVLPDQVLLIKTGDFAHKNVSISVPDYLRGRFQAQTIPEYLPDFAWLVLEDVLHATTGKIDRVYVMAHRKLVVPLRQGVFLKNENTYYDIGKNVDLNKILPLVVPKRLFLPQLERCDGIVHQYARYHDLHDFRVLVDMCVRVGILDRNEVVRFAYSQIMPRGGGLLGMVPADIMLTLCSKIKALVIYALSSGFTPNQPSHPYQARALSFFIERLASYFLLCEFSRFGPVVGWSTNEVFGGNLLTTANTDSLPNSYSHGTTG